MKKSHTLASDGKSENTDVIKRVYRAISDTVHRLDDHHHRAHTCSDLFTADAQTLRGRLRDNCERLIFLDPIGYGRKAENLLWRKGYYEVISTGKQLRKGSQWSPLEMAYVQSHLAAGVGHYHHLLFRLQTEFHLDMMGTVDFPFIGQDGGLAKGKMQPQKPADPAAVNWAQQAVHHCLMCIGDLSRYQLVFHPHHDLGIPQRYYHQALNVNLDAGMPHNQLGTLTATTNYGLDAVYHYMRCLISPEGFEGAEGNLKRIFERNINRYEDAKQDLLEEGKVGDPVWDIRRCISGFLALIDILFYDKCSDSDVGQLCQRALVDIQQCLCYDRQPYLEENLVVNIKVSQSEKQEERYEESQVQLAGAPEAQNTASLSVDDLNGSQLSDEDGPELTDADHDHPHALHDDVVFRMVVITLICVWKLQESGSQQAAAGVAFALAFLSHLTQHVIKHLREAVFSCIALASSFTPSPPPVSSRPAVHDEMPSLKECQIADVTDKCSSTVINGCEEDEREVEKKKNVTMKNKMLKLRRRRRRHSSEDSDLSDGELSDELSDQSEDLNSDISETDEPGPAVMSSESEVESEEESLNPTEDVKVQSGGTVGSEIMRDNVCVDSAGELLTVSNSDPPQELPAIRKVSHKYKQTGNSKLPHVSEDKVVRGDSDPQHTSQTPTMEDGAQMDYDHDLTKKISIVPESELLSAIAEEGLLCTIKVYVDWLWSNNYVIQECGQSSQVLWWRMCTLFNMLNLDISSITSDGIHCKFVKQLNTDPSVVMATPLPEDTMLRGFPLLKDSHDHLKWDSYKHLWLSSKEEAFLRVQHLLKFGHHLTTFPKTNITYNAQKRLFQHPAEVTSQNGMSQGTDITGAEPVETQRRQLMHSMAQLWLKEEVKHLELKVHQKQANFSPYLVVDSSSLTSHMALVKQLAAAKKFIIVIPAVVVHVLDELKKDSGGAREAIRWLENQFHRGNRFLRAQRNHERLSLYPMKYPKKKEKDAWTFFQILECCHYFSSRMGGTDEADSCLVTLLTGDKGTEKTCAKSFNSSGLAKSAGFNFEHVETFHSKWKNSTKSHG